MTPARHSDAYDPEPDPRIPDAAELAREEDWHRAAVERRRSIDYARHVRTPEHLAGECCADPWKAVRHERRRHREGAAFTPTRASWAETLVAPLTLTPHPPRASADRHPTNQMANPSTARTPQRSFHEADMAVMDHDPSRAPPTPRLTCGPLRRETGGHDLAGVARATTRGGNNVRWIEGGRFASL